MKERLSVVVVFGSKILIAILGVVLLSFETKYINPDVFGEYSLLSGIINAGVSFFISWIGSAGLRYYDSNKNQLGKFNSTVFSGGMISTVLLLLVICLVGFIFPGLYITKYLMLVVFLIVLKSSYEIYEKVLRASANFVLYSILTVLQYVINVSVFYALAINHRNDLSTVFISLIVSLIFFDLLAFTLSRSYKGLSIKNTSPELSKVFLKYGIPMIGTWAISWLLNYSDRYMIKLFYTTYEVGLYTTAYTVSQSAIGIITSSITLTFFPILIKRWNQGGRDVATQYVNKILEYYILFMIPAVFGIGFVARQFYGTLIDANYIGGAAVIMLGAIGFFFTGLNDILYKLWQLEEKTNRIFGLMMLSFVINVILNAILLPVFGFIVAAYTTIASYLLIFIIAFWIVQKSFAVKINIVRIIQSIIAVIPMCFILFFTKPIMNSMIGLVASIIIAGGSYMLVQVALGNFRDECKMLIGKIKTIRGAK